MDLMYMSDSFSIRQYSYDRYEEIHSKTDQYKLPSHQQKKSSQTSDHKKCSICKERQKRQLAHYIKRQNSQNTDAILEEEEEKTDEKTKTDTQQRR